MAPRARPPGAHPDPPSQEQPTPPRPPVAIKGGGEGLRILVSAGSSPAVVRESLREQISRRAGAFFVGAPVVLELPPGELDLALAGQLAPLITEAGMRLLAVEVGGDRRALRRAEAAPARPAAPAAGALVVQGPLRSGQRVAHGGPVLVLGDVNPGAEVVSGESVVVWGRLRGTVEAGLAEAGEGGVAEAIVCALDLVPTQLRIGAALARAPEEPEREPVPEVARVQDGRIVVEPWR